MKSIDEDFFIDHRTEVTICIQSTAIFERDISNYVKALFTCQMIDRPLIIFVGAFFERNKLPHTHDDGMNISEINCNWMASR